MKTATKVLEEVQNLFKTLSTQSDEIFKKIKPDNKLIETIEPLYVNERFKDEFKLPTVYRFNQQGMRYYFTASDDNQVIFYPSVTTIISNTTPMSYGLKTILAEKGMAGFSQYMKEKADYGTLMHTLITDYLRSGNTAETRFFDFDEIAGKIALFADEKHISYSTAYWEWNMKKDIASLIKFCRDYEVEPIAIEAVGIYNDGKNHFAGAIDLLCYMTIEEKGFWGETYKTGENKGKPKESKRQRRVIAVIDFKSGKAGFFTDHEVQLNMYKMMVEQSFGIVPEKLYNVAPSEWISEPNYKIKDQTDSPHAAKIPFMLGQYGVEWQEPKDILMISGKCNGNGLGEAVRMVPAREFVLYKLGRMERTVKTLAMKDEVIVFDDFKEKTDTFAEGGVNPETPIESTNVETLEHVISYKRNGMDIVTEINQKANEALNAKDIFNNINNLIKG